MNIVGLVGKSGSGKDTVANILVNEGYERVASADTMKDDLCRYLDITHEEFEQYKNKPLKVVHTEEGFHHMKGEDRFGKTRIFGKFAFDFSLRRLLQQYGMDMRDHFGPDYWISRSVKKILDADEVFVNESKKQVVISDIRFQNEWDYVKSMGGKVVLIKGREELTQEDQKQHITEQLATNPNTEIEADLIITNDGSLEDLKCKVEALI